NEVTHLHQLTTTLATVLKSHLTPEPRVRRTRSSASAAALQASSKGLQVPSTKLPQTKDRDDYPDVPYWDEKQWRDWVEIEKNLGHKLTRFGFITDSDGDPVLKQRLKEFSDTSQVCWNELRQHGEHPDSWKKKSHTLQEFYYHMMLSRYPEFLLAANYWKLEAYATIKYPDYMQNRQDDDEEKLTYKRPREHCNNLSKPNKQKRLSPPHGMPVIEIEDDGTEASLAPGPSQTPAPSTPQGLAQTRSNVPAPATAIEAQGPTNLSASGPPRLQRPKPRRILNPLKNVTIPTLPEITTAIEPTTIEPTAKRSRPLKPKDGVTTARNLYLIDYLASHPEATEGEFSAAWKICDARTKEKFQQLSKEQTKARKKGPQATENPSRGPINLPNNENLHNS
ncbi:hypothetical protein C0992_008393, partial [Termitomyces sp. T32_za158]